MKTNNGYNFSIKKEICTLLIPKQEGEHGKGAQTAKREICLNQDLPYFREIRIKKVGTFKTPK